MLHSQIQNTPLRTWINLNGLTEILKWGNEMYSPDLTSFWLWIAWVLLHIGVAEVRAQEGWSTTVIQASELSDTNPAGGDPKHVFKTILGWLLDSHSSAASDSWRYPPKLQLDYSPYHTNRSICGNVFSTQLGLHTYQSSANNILSP